MYYVLGDDTSHRQTTKPHTDKRQNLTQLSTHEKPYILAKGRNLIMLREVSSVCRVRFCRFVV